VSTLAAAADALQAGYEDGELSYPRSTSGALAEASIAPLSALATDLGLRFEPRRIPVFVAERGQPHEGVHASAPVLEGSGGGAARMAARLTRQWLQVGVVDGTEHVHAEVPGLPVWAQALSWQRPAAEIPDAVLHPEQRAPRQGIVPYASEVIAVRLLAVHGLARPSTIVDMAQRMVAAGWITKAGVTVEGHLAHGRSPDALTRPETARAIEAMIGDDAAPAEATGDVPPVARIQAALALVPALAGRAGQRAQTDGGGGDRAGSAEAAGAPVPEPVAARAAIRRRRRRGFATLEAPLEAPGAAGLPPLPALFVVPDAGPPPAVTVEPCSPEPASASPAEPRHAGVTMSRNRCPEAPPEQVEDERWRQRWTSGTTPSPR
jgi:hypothetical protein